MKPSNNKSRPNPYLDIYLYVVYNNNDNNART